MRIILDGEKMKDKKSTHEYLKGKFKFLSYYGRNLDALWDLLNDINEEINIIIINTDSIYKNLDSYGKSLIKVFLDLEKEKNNVTLEIE